jgi:hypothetical protein
MKPYDFYVTPEEYSQAAANGISAKTLDVRIRRFGWDKQRAIAEPLRQKRSIAEPLRQKRSIAEWLRLAKQNGIKESTFYARINKSGWDLERAATTPLCLRPYELAAAARVKIPQEIKDLAAVNDIALGTFKSRVYQSGWDMQRAATEPVWSPTKTGVYGKRRYIEVHDVDPIAELFPHRGRKYGGNSHAATTRNCGRQLRRRRRSEYRNRTGDWPIGGYSH